MKGYGKVVLNASAVFGVAGEAVWTMEESEFRGISEIVKTMN